MCELGVDAYAEARRKEFEASSDGIARDWGRVARVIANAPASTLRTNRGRTQTPHLSAKAL
jgi:hypothetical protein